VKSLFGSITDPKHLDDPNFRTEFLAHQKVQIENQLSPKTCYVRGTDKFEAYMFMYEAMYSSLFNPELWHTDEDLLRQITHFVKDICACSDPFEGFRMGMTDEITVSMCGVKPPLTLSGEIMSLKDVTSQSSMKREVLVISWAENTVRILFEFYIHCTKAVHHQFADGS
jgi:hypothetical protein